MTLVPTSSSGNGGASAASVIGPYTVTFTDFNDAVGGPIYLGSAFAIGQLVEPVGFFPTYFDGGIGSHQIRLGVRNPSHGGDPGTDVIFDSNAPNDAIADFTVSGLYNDTGGFPRRTAYRITAADVQLKVECLPATDQTRGTLVVLAFVWTPS